MNATWTMLTKNSGLRTRQRRKARAGVVTVELALTLGLAFFFFFAALEFSRVSMIRHTVDHAAYEAARTGIVPGATVAQVEAKARQVLATGALRVFDLTITPSPIPRSAPTITVKIGVPLDRNLFAPANFFGGKRFERSFTMQRETGFK